MGKIFRKQVLVCTVDGEGRCAPKGGKETFQKFREEVKARGGKIIAVVNEGDRELSAKVDHVISVPRTIEMLQPILTVVPLQLLAYAIAVKRGCSVDQPRNLAKSVTVE